MQKAARIRRLGDALKQIDDAIARIDLSAMDPDKLLSLKLKYEAALRAEYTGAEEALPIGEARASKDEVFYLYSALFERVRNGETTIEQAKIEMATIQSMRKAYNVATAAPDLGEELFGNAREISNQISLYDQIDEREADNLRAELKADDTITDTQQGLKRSEAPLSMSTQVAQAALREQLKRLIDSNDVSGLSEFLSTYLTDQSEEPEESESGE